MVVTQGGILEKKMSQRMVPTLRESLRLIYGRRINGPKTSHLRQYPSERGVKFNNLTLNMFHYFDDFQTLIL